MQFKIIILSLNEIWRFRSVMQLLTSRVEITVPCFTGETLLFIVVHLFISEIVGVGVRKIYRREFLCVSWTLFAAVLLWVSTFGCFLRVIKAVDVSRSNSRRVHWCKISTWFLAVVRWVQMSLRTQRFHRLAFRSLRAFQFII